jgi:hypothetical protein
MGQSHHSKKRLFDAVIALMLLLAAREGEPSSDELQGEAGQRHPSSFGRRKRLAGR